MLMPFITLTTSSASSNTCALLNFFPKGTGNKNLNERGVCEINKTFVSVSSLSPHCKNTSALDIDQHDCGVASALDEQITVAE